MREQYAELLPNWYQSDEIHDLVLSDDIDSLVSCCILDKIKGWKIEYFYNFDTVYASQTKQNRINRKCWVDIATISGHAFDNHVSKFTLWDNWNDNMINLNAMCDVTNENYTDKYAGSTLLTIWSVYNLPLPTTEVGKMLLLCIDSAYKGFYSSKFHDTQKYYLVDIMGFDELYAVIKRHKQEEFEELTTKYGLNRKIVYVNGKIYTTLPLEQIGQALEIDIELPQKQMHACTYLQQVQADIKKDYICMEEMCRGIKTMAITYKNKAKYSKIRRSDK